MTAARGADQAGFTLLELLVVLVVAALLLAGVTQGSHMVLRFAEREHGMLAATDDLDAVSRSLREMIAQMEPGGRADRHAIVGTGRSLRFITRLPFPPGAEPTRRAEVMLAVDDRHRLVLRWAWRPHVRQPPPATADAVLLRGIARLAIRYRGPGVADGWQARWDGWAPPMLVRVHIAFRSGDPRRWPDIVAAPMRAAPDR